MKTNKQIASDLLQIAKEVEKVWELTGGEFYAEVISGIETAVLDVLGAPEDDYDNEDESGFCRDWLLHMIDERATVEELEQDVLDAIAAMEREQR